jgi:photosynthetic reaction center cytochrome c subunit
MDRIFSRLLHCRLRESSEVKSNCFCRLGVGLGLIVSSLAAIASGQIERSKPAPARPELSREAFKNIQILQDTPADQLIPAMQFISSSLGVECSFCHVEGALEKDDKKPKQTARKMMQMMAAINQTTFAGKRKITCYSCHRGYTRPVTTPLIAEAETSATLENVPSEQSNVSRDPPQVDAIIAKYVDAMGGPSAIGRLITRVEKGHIALAGRQFPIEIFSKIPGKRLSVIHLPSGDNVIAYDGVSGWSSAPNRPAHDIPAAAIASARLETDLQLPIHLKQLFSEIKAGRAGKIGGREVCTISGGNAGELVAILYFDEHSGLLLRMLRYENSPLGLNPTQIDYGDYREQDGVKVPFRETVSRPNSRLVIQLDEAKYNVPLDDAKFLRPADPATDKPASP